MRGDETGSRQAHVGTAASFEPALSKRSASKGLSRRAKLDGQRTCGEAAIKTVNLKSDRPSVHEALQRLEKELSIARQELARQGNIGLLKIIHGYGSSGAGGDIRIAVQRRLQELVEAGQIRACIFGENWSRSDETTWCLLQEDATLKKDPHLGRRNLGITIVVL